MATQKTTVAAITDNSTQTQQRQYDVNIKYLREILTSVPFSSCRYIDNSASAFRYSRL